MRELVESENQLKAATADYERMGWEVVDQTAGRVVVKRGLRGSWLPHILYFLLAPIYGNLIYSAFRRYDRPEHVVIRIRDFAERSTKSVSEDENGPSVDDSESSS